MMTYSEWVAKNPTLLQERTELDPATIEALTDWFGLRYLCDDDHFSVFYTREINMLQWQYDQMKRLESVQFDPMVSQYMERWSLNTGSDTHHVTSENEGTSSQESSGKTSNNSSSTPGVRETVETVHTPNTTVVSTGSSDGTSSGSSTNESTSHETNNSKGSNNQETTSSTDNKSLAGVLPDSATYGPSTDPNNPNTDENGLPMKLNWTYASSQTGSHGIDSSSVVGNNESGSESNGNSTASVEDSTETHTDSESTVKTTGEDTTTVQTSKTGSDNVESQGTSQGTVDGKTSGTSSETGDNTFRHEDKYIHTGRGEAPQDMLDRARSYILKMNAFDWLRKQLDSCFLGVYNI